MRFALILIALAIASPAGGWCLVTEPIPFYVFDGTSYTALFMLPETYFVALEQRGEEYDRVSFLDLEGYVRSGAAESVDYEPVSKFPASGSAELIKSVSSVWLYADARLSSVIGEVTAADDIFLYGTAPSGNAFYVRVGTPDDYIRGYLSGDAVTVTYPPTNDISAVAPSDPDPEPSPEPSDPSPQADLSPFVQIVLVISLTVPAFLLVFLLSAKR